MAIEGLVIGDSEFRERLIADPKKTIEAEYGLEEGALKEADISIVEERPGALILPVPP